MHCAVGNGPTFGLWVLETFLGKDSKDRPGFSHLQAPCLFTAAHSPLTSFQQRRNQGNPSSWSALTKMSLLLQNTLCHIRYKYLKPNRFLMRYDG